MSSSQSGHCLVFGTALFLSFPNWEKSALQLKSQALQKSQQLLRIAEFLKFQKERVSHKQHGHVPSPTQGNKAIRFGPVAFSRALKHLNLKHVPKTLALSFV